MDVRPNRPILIPLCLKEFVPHRIKESVIFSRDQSRYFGLQRCVSDKKYQENIVFSYR